MAIIPNRGGEFILPEVNIEWWDINTQTIKTATLPAKTITVLGDTKTNTANQSASAVQLQNNGANENTAAAPAVEKINPWLWTSSILFGVLALVLGMYAFSLKSRLKALQNQQEDVSEVISEKEKHIWDLLKHAAANKDAVALRKHILSWAKFQWPDAAIHSLDDVAKLGGKIELTHALKKLDELLYSNHPSEEWEPSHLLQLLNESRKERKTRKRSEGLKPLYSN